MKKLCSPNLTTGDKYDIITSRGRVELEVVSENVGIFGSDYRHPRWHDRIPDIYVGLLFDEGVVQEIRKRA